MYKPRDGADDAEAPALAPLILWEVEREARPAAHFGAVFIDPDGQVHVDVTQPTIYVSRSTTAIGGRPYERVTYRWWGPGPSDTRGDAGVRMFGFRMTLGRDGFPLVWEAVDCNRSCDVTYVSTSLEEAATRAFDAPVAGRAFAIERSVESAPGTVVVRVLEDGPMPMGPYVYIDAMNGNVTTLLCRCMASQVERIVSTAYYDIRPLAEVGDRMKLERAGAPDFSDVPLDRWLRWPDSYDSD
jgi:hypothetical protein